MAELLELLEERKVAPKLSFSQRLGGMLASNSTTAREIATNRPLKQAAGLYIFSIIILGCLFTLSSYIRFRALKGAISMLAGLDINESVKSLITDLIQQETFGTYLTGIYWQLIIITIGVVLFWLGSMMLAHFISKGLGGQGNIISSFCIGAYLTPIIWMFAAVSLLLPTAELLQNYTILFIIPILCIILFVWLARSFITNMSIAHQISKGKTATAFFLMILLWIVIGLVVWFASPLGGI